MWTEWTICLQTTYWSYATIWQTTAQYAGSRDAGCAWLINSIALAYNNHIWVESHRFIFHHSEVLSAILAATALDLNVT